VHSAKSRPAGHTLGIDTPCVFLTSQPRETPLRHSALKVPLSTGVAVLRGRVKPSAQEVIFEDRGPQSTFECCCVPQEQDAKAT